MKDADNVPRDENRAWQPCLLTICFYLPLAAASAWMSRYAMNPDGVGYLRTAEYYARGDWALAINGYWSPLLSWLLVPLIRAGLDPLVAVRALQIVIGAGLIYTAALLTVALGGRRHARSVACVCAALAAIPMSRSLITPDLLLACLIAIYLAFALEPAVAKPTRAFATGVVAGGAYLAKAYALPFFLVHYALSTLYWVRHVALPMPRSRWLAAWTVATVGFFAVAAPWALMISQHYGRPMFSSAGPLNRAFLNPDVAEPSQVVHALQLPAAGRLSVWEDPTNVNVRTWSPFQSLHYFLRQLQWAWSNLKAIANDLKSIDLGGLLLVVWGYALARTASPGCCSARRRAVLWVVLSAALYAAGYLLLPRGGPRYLWPLVPPGIALLALFVERSPAPTRRLATILVILSFAATYLYDTYGLWGAWPGKGNYEVAMQARSLPLEAPVAANAWGPGLFVCYHLRIPYLGRPQSTEPKAMVAELRSAGAKAFLVFNDARLSADLGNLAGLTRLNGVPLKGHDGVVLDVFALAPHPG